ncbi:MULTISPECIES: WD40/YVTN/BNR-like repeat-containing protein [unclassified Pseudomonas]|uniref:WD40/YVTN/BNR-like repeat-containing protein n=1 Tax=unclassified Pseudomonas TaxID=196821 RepID=UPI0018E7E824|nr:MULTISPECIES: YCF48-related protein [unclassified Pseudomonas]MBJ2303700.1 glycosyl hydrolase [Pseudomonas sp. MF2846]MBK3490307.1 glycosyl hydrolase [Pseudomonas sp. MF2857]
MATVRYMFVLATVLVAGLSNVANAQTDFTDPLDRPASAVVNLTGAHLNSVTAAGDRLIAVGARGLIIVSDDAGANWTQAASPVSSDLLGVHFPTARQGWAVGHDGVILHSSDGGGSWVKQFDGVAASKMLTEHFDKLVAAGDESAASFQDGVKLNYQDGPEQALMGVWFSDENNGVVVGTFGTLFATRDGGKTWESWMERAENPDFLHYMAISGSDDELYIASERGVVFKLDAQAQRFKRLETGYTGSFFSIKATPTSLIAAGLRGSAFKSLDGGTTWQALPTGINVALSDVQSLPDGRFLLAGVDGKVVISDVAVSSFKPLSVSRPGRFTSLIGLKENKAVSVGFSGVREVTVQ